MEKWCAKRESDHNALAQYGQQNNTIVSGIPDSVYKDRLEEKVISFLANIDVFVSVNDTEACNRFGKGNDIVACNKFDKTDNQKSHKTLVE